MIGLFWWVAGAFLAGAALAAIVAWLFYQDLLDRAELARADLERVRKMVTLLIRICDHASLGRGVAARRVVREWDQELAELPYSLPMPQALANVVRRPSNSEQAGGKS